MTEFKAVPETARPVMLLESLDDELLIRYDRCELCDI